MSPYQVPTGFEDVLKDLTKEVIKAQPADVTAFCAEYFSKKLTLRDTNTRSPPLGTVSPATTALRNNTGSSPMPPTASPSTDAANLQNTEETEEDLAALRVIQQKSQSRGRRHSVSAESLKPSDFENIPKVVIPKTTEQRERIERAISRNFLFRHLDDEQHIDVINAMAEKQVKQGLVLIRQGDEGDFFYVVETGIFEIFVSRDGGKTSTKVVEIGSGGSFGELALMYNAPRAATVIAKCDGVLWALDRVTFRRILMNTTNAKRKMYEKFLDEVSLLSSLTSYEKCKIADALESVTYEPGEVVIKQGDVGDKFYMIESGEAVVLKKDEMTGADKQVARLKKGDYFGELALLMDKPRAATVLAATRMKAAALDREAFTRLLGPCVDILQRNTEQYRNYIAANPDLKSQ